jgi:SPP1 family predicted phage head-tail adaptor
MMWRDICELLGVTSAPDGYGGFTDTEVSRTVFCDRKSIKATEFYQAHATGLKPEITLVIRAVDYADETKVRFNEKVYDVLRTYSKNGELIELTCAKRTELMS